MDEKRGSAFYPLTPVAPTDWSGARDAFIEPAMFDRFYLPALALAAIAAVAFASVWPQGRGDRSPAPFGSTPVQRTPAMQAAMQREAAAAQRRTSQQQAAFRDMQTQALAPSQ